MTVRKKIIPRWCGRWSAWRATKWAADCSLAGRWPAAVTQRVISLSGAFDSRKPFECRVAEHGQLACAGVLVRIAKVLGFRPGNEIILAFPYGMRGKQRVAFLLIESAAQQVEFLETLHFGKRRFAVLPHVLESLLLARLYLKTVHRDVHGIPFLLPVDWIDQNGPIGRVKAQLARSACGGIGGKGAARWMIDKAASSSPGEPELLTSRMERTSPPAPTTKDTWHCCA